MKNNENTISWRNASSNHGCRAVTWYFALDQHGGLAVIEHSKQSLYISRVLSLCAPLAILCSKSRYKHARLKDQLIALFLDLFIVWPQFFMFEFGINDWINNVKK